MRAIVYTHYGAPSVLQLKEIEKPTPGDNDVLVKVYAAAINSADLDYLRGTFLIRLGGPRQPMYKILGTDIAGRVEAVGKNVTQFQPGDEVFGDLSECGFGAFAEYVSVPEHAVVLKPAHMTFEQAAAVPTAAVIALQGLRKGQIRAGKKVLINGAGGGVGTFAIQMAKLFGAEVTAVDSAKKLDMLRSLGADHVIDYTRDDFTKNGQSYDLILEVIARRSINDYKRALTPTGHYVMVGGSNTAILQALVMGSWMSKKGSQSMGILMARPNPRDLMAVKELVETGKIAPVIDKCYPLSETGDALQYLEDGHARGKVVITVDSHNKI